MKSYTPEELQAVLAEHKKWLLGIGGSRADLRDAVLCGAVLCVAALTAIREARHD